LGTTKERASEGKIRGVGSTILKHGPSGYLGGTRKEKRENSGGKGDLPRFVSDQDPEPGLKKNRKTGAWRGVLKKSEKSPGGVQGVTKAKAVFKGTNWSSRNGGGEKEGPGR